MSLKSKYSKNKLIGKRRLMILIIILILILVFSISYTVYINVTNNIVYEKVNNSCDSVDDNIASNSTPVIINNIILGGVYEGKWVGMERYYFKSVNKDAYDIDIFTHKGKTGTFKIKNVSKGAGAGAAYVTTTATNYKDEYIAMKSGNITTSKMDAITLDGNSTLEYKKYVKDALGLYGMLNGSVKIREVYQVSVVPGKMSYIITATNDGKTSDGVYSSVIYVNENKEAKLVKYNYVKNVSKSSDFAVYTTKFVADLNGDNVCEIILQGTTEFNTKYSVVEFKNGDFTEVLSTTIGNSK